MHLKTTPFNHHSNYYLQVYERYGPQRFNIIHVTCALSCLADKTADRLASNKQPLKAELAALRRFVGQLLETASSQAPSIDAATAAALLHSLARLANTGKVCVCVFVVWLLNDGQ